MNRLFLTDLDGAVRPPHAGKTASKPPHQLHGIFHAMKKAGYAIAGATGASYKSARATEHHLSIRFDFLSPSYCTRLLRRGNPHGQSEFHLVPQNERWAVESLHTPLDDICHRHRGTADDRGACYTKFLPCERTFSAAAEEVSRVVTGVDGVRHLANRYDFGITVVAASAGKHLAVQWLLDRDYEIVVAAGDTKSDIPLLEAAAFPIVTLTNEDAQPCPELVAIAERKGGYVATRPHGHGLAAGLLHARESGMISF